MYYDIPEALLPHIERAPSSPYPIGRRVLILEGRYSGRTGRLVTACAETTFEVDIEPVQGRPGHGPMHTAEVALLDPDLVPGHHVYTLDTLPSLPDRAAVRGEVLRIGNTYPARPEPWTIVEQDRHDSTVIGSLVSLTHIDGEPTDRGTQRDAQFVGTYIRVSGDAASVVDDLRNQMLAVAVTPDPASSASVVGATGDATATPVEGQRIRVRNIPEVRVGQDTVTGVLAHIDDTWTTTRYYMVPDPGQDMDYPQTRGAGSYHGQPTWYVRREDIVEVIDTDRPFQPGDRIFVTEMSDYDVRQWVTAVVDRLDLDDEEGLDLRVRFEGGQPEAHRLFGYEGAEQWVKSESEVIYAPTGGTPAPRSLQVGDTIRIDAHANEGIARWAVGAQGRLVRTWVDTSSAPGAIGFQVEITQDAPGHPGHVGQFLTEITGATLVTPEVTPDAPRAWQVGDAVRITGHASVSRFVGLLGRVEEIGAPTTYLGAPVLGVGVKVWDPESGVYDVLRQVTGMELLLGADEPQPTFQVGDRVFGLESQAVSDWARLPMLIREGVVYSTDAALGTTRLGIRFEDGDLDRRVNFDRVAPVTRLSPVPADQPEAPEVPRLQRDDLVRITAHPQAGLVGRYARVGEQDLAAPLGWSLRLGGQYRPDIRATAVEAVWRATEEQVTDFAAGDEVIGVVRADDRGDTWGMFPGTVRNADYGDGRLGITIENDEQGEVGSWTRVYRLRTAAEVRASLAELTLRHDIQIGDIVRLPSDEDFMVTEITARGPRGRSESWGLRTLAWDSLQFEHRHRSPRLDRLDPEAEWDEGAVRIPASHIQTIAEFAGEANGEQSKVETLVSGLRTGYMPYGTYVYDVVQGERIASFSTERDAAAWVERRPTRDGYTWSEVQGITAKTGQNVLGWCGVAIATREALRPSDPRRADPAATRYTVREVSPGVTLRWEVVSPRNDGGTRWAVFASEEFATAEAARLNGDVPTEADPLGLL